MIRSDRPEDAPVLQNSPASPLGADPADGDVACRVARIARDVLAGAAVTRDDATWLFSLEADDRLDLFYWANRIRVKFTGRRVKFCSIVASKVGACSEDCGYCSQSKHYKTHVTPAKMKVDEMASARDEAERAGASSFGLVNSGRGPTERELDWMEPFFRETAEQGRIRPCATLGELTDAQAQRLKDMGVLRVNHNLETSRRHFDNVITTHTYDDRLATIRRAKAAGLSICSGGIFGLGEGVDDRVDMLFDLKSLDVDVVPINFLHAWEGTPVFGKQDELSPMEALQIVAVARFILPTQEIKVAGGREKILRDLQSWMFFAGASSFLIGNYLTSFGRSAEDDHKMLADLGLPFVTFDEVEREAEPTSVASAGVSLPVLG
jgi:biotin synthase